jgi:hypothetical protein
MTNMEQPDDMGAHSNRPADDKSAERSPLDVMELYKELPRIAGRAASLVFPLSLIRSDRDTTPGDILNLGNRTDDFNVRNRAENRIKNELLRDPDRVLPQLITALSLPPTSKDPEACKRINALLSERYLNPGLRYLDNHNVDLKNFVAQTRASFPDLERGRQLCAPHPPEHRQAIESLERAVQKAAGQAGQESPARYNEFMQSRFMKDYKRLMAVQENIPRLSAETRMICANEITSQKTFFAGGVHNDKDTNFARRQVMAAMTEDPSLFKFQNPDNFKNNTDNWQRMISLTDVLRLDKDPRFVRHLLNIDPRHRQTLEYIDRLRKKGIEK